MLLDCVYKYISFSLAWDPMGAQKFQTLLLLKITAKISRTGPEFFFQWSLQIYLWFFSEKFEFPTLTICFWKFEIQQWNKIWDSR